MIRTAKEISKLPKFAKNRCGGVYRLSDLTYIDNIDGFGVEKAHSDIKNRGFIGHATIKAFQSICCGAINEVQIAEVISAIEAGHGIACPQAYLDIDSYMSSGHGKCKVATFTGFNTSVALSRLGIEEMEFQFILLGYGMRNIENPTNFFNWVSAGIHTMCNTFIKTPFNKLTIGV